VDLGQTFVNIAENFQSEIQINPIIVEIEKHLQGQGGQLHREKCQIQKMKQCTPTVFPTSVKTYNSVLWA
jgi:hypothetical protein